MYSSPQHYMVDTTACFADVETEAERLGNLSK